MGHTIVCVRAWAAALSFSVIGSVITLAAFIALTN